MKQKIESLRYSKGSRNSKSPRLYTDQKSEGLKLKKFPSEPYKIQT